VITQTRFARQNPEESCEKWRSCGKPEKAAPGFPQLLGNLPKPEIPTFSQAPAAIVFTE
jgi:hypothetical protein